MLISLWVILIALNHQESTMPRICLTLLAFPLFSLTAYAAQVPTELFSISMLDGYMEYSRQQNYKAFAISNSGHWGSSWGYASEEAARNAAINNCGSTQQCKVISSGGVIQGDAIEESDLRRAFEQTLSRTLPQPPQNMYPKELATYRNTHESYRVYLSDRGNKAFALGGDGSWGKSFEIASIANARSVALAECENVTNQQGTCRVVDINNQAVNGFKPVAPAPVYSSPTVNQIPLSVNRFPTLQIYHDYLTKPGHRALYVSGEKARYRYGDHSMEDAIQFAKEECEALMGRTAPCVLAAVDDRIEGGSYAYSLVQYPSSHAELEIPEDLKEFFDDINYNHKKGHRALAVNNFGAYGFVYNYVNPDMAKQDALKMCEAWVSVRQKSGRFKGRNAPCHLIAENQTLIKDNVERVISQSGID
jgi:hypothetical protein